MSYVRYCVTIDVWATFIDGFCQLSSFIATKLPAWFNQNLIEHTFNNILCFDGHFLFPIEIAESIQSSEPFNFHCLLAALRLFQTTDNLAKVACSMCGQYTQSVLADSRHNKIITFRVSGIPVNYRSFNCSWSGRLYVFSDKLITNKCITFCHFTKRDTFEHRAL